MIKAFILGYRGDSAPLYVTMDLRDSDHVYDSNHDVPMNLDTTSTRDAIISAIPSTIQSYLTGIGYPTADEIVDLTTNVMSPREFSTPSRSLDSAFTISSSRDALVMYAVKSVSSLSLTAGQQAKFTLQYADDSAFTTNVVTLPAVENGNTGTFVIGLNTTQTIGSMLGGVIPAGKYVKIVSSNVTGSPTKTFVSAQEVLL